MTLIGSVVGIVFALVFAWALVDIIKEIKRMGRQK